MLAGVLALGSVSWCQALETWPSMPPGAEASSDQRRRPARSASAASSAAPGAAAGRARLRGVRAVRNVAARPAASSASTISSEQRAELVPGVGARADERAVGR